MIRQFELVEMVRAYNPAADEGLINRAYVFGVNAHGRQRRANGEPYFNHPVEVAAILTGLRLDDATIVTALLHDTIEDTEATAAQLAELFGDEIARLVDGVTKLSKLTLVSKERAQAENLRKLLVAMARDPRVLLVKMADRLHNMRTIKHLRPEKRERIARETLEIFAPLAGRMGMQWMREELEDLAFDELQPDARRSVMRRFVHLSHTEGPSPLDDIVAALEAALADSGLAATVSGRKKRPYGIWRKMQTKQISFEQLSDIIGFRLIVDTEADCYRALGVVHGAFRAVPGRFKDYISGPKANGYRSLHTTVIGPDGARIELQIRTHEMHEVAESGVAAHWAYKDGVRGENRFAVDPFHWLRDLVARMERPLGPDEEPEEFLENAKFEMAFEQVFIFTPKGDVIGLPFGSTALDFAYAIHTDVGHGAVGAKIDGRRAPLSSTLRNGQTVEVQTSDAQRPKPVWLNMVSTGRARGAIRRTLLAEERDEAARLGEKIVERVFERADAAFSGKALSAAATRLGQPDAAGVLAEVARGRIAAADVLAAVYPDKAVGDGAQDQSAPGPGQLVPSENGAQVVLGRGAAAADGAVGEGRVTIPTACCCRPIPGERIVGLAEPGVGVRVHAINCPRLEAYEDAMDLWLDLAWAPEASARPSHLTSVLVTLSNEAGALGGTATLIAEAGCNIDLVETVDRKPDYYRLRFDLLVRDIRHLSNLLTTLNAQPAVAEAVRTPPPRRSDSEALEPGPQRRAAPRASPPASAPEQTAESAGGGDPAATPPPATISETTPI